MKPDNKTHVMLFVYFFSPNHTLLRIVISDFFDPEINVGGRNMRHRKVFKCVSKVDSRLYGCM